MDATDDEALYHRWRSIRLQLEQACAPRSVLPAALSAYAIDEAGSLTFEGVVAIRAEHGIRDDPDADVLFPLLDVAGGSPANRQTGHRDGGLPVRRQV